MYHRLDSEVLPKLVPPFSKVLLAVSGGPDSVALAHVIWRYAAENKELGISLVITHVNHKVRKEADDEALLVKSLAKELGADYILHEFDAKKNAYEKRQSFQEASREWRYTRFQEDMDRSGCSLLATAHHLGDQAETVLYRLLRGSGTSGLAGIYPVSNRIIRPFLTVTKVEILEYCQNNNLAYAIDQSNLESNYSRNKIRLELIPKLEQDYNPRLQEALGRTAELLRWDEEYLQSQTDRLWAEYCLHAENGRILLSLSAWDEPDAILSRLLRRAAAEVTGEWRGLEFKFIKILIREGKKTGWQQDLPGLGVENTTDGFLFFRKELDSEHLTATNKTTDELPKLTEIQLTLNRWYPIPGYGIQAGVFDYFPDDNHIIWHTEVDSSQLMALKNPIICRERRAGDRIYFSNLGHKTIKKVFQERDISTSRRDKILLVAAGNDVIWIPGICRSGSLIPSKDFPALYIVIAKGKPLHSLDSL